jgi:hypothetical protein
MSIDSIRFHCTGCDYEYLEHFQPIKLKCRIGDGVATYGRKTAWCNQCDTIRYVESVPTLEDLQKEYADLIAPPPEKPPVSWITRVFIKVFKLNESTCQSGWHNDRRKNLENLIAWRQTRTAPPHCLNCGSTDLTTLNFEQLDEQTMVAKNFRHACGGQLVRDHNDDPGIRFLFRDTVIWLDIEGNRLVCDENG